MNLTKHQYEVIQTLANLSGADCEAIGRFLCEISRGERRPAKQTCHEANMSVWLLHEYGVLGRLPDLVGLYPGPYPGNR